MLKKFPFFRQYDKMDCGPTCLKMIAAYYKKDYPLQYLREHAYLSRNGVSIRGIIHASEKIGFRTLPIKIPFYSKSKSHFLEAPTPCIVHWNQNHFIVVYKKSKAYIWVADPASGRHKLTYNQFKKGWVSDHNKGVAILLSPTPDFYEQIDIKSDKKKISYLFRYLIPYKKLFFQLIIGLIIGSLFQLIVPFLTQSLVDIGIQNQNIGFIWMILLAQIMIFFGQISVNLIQNWILLHISTRINVALISDFLIKLMRLPLGFFDTKMIGDLLQRINDHKRIESFLTAQSLQLLFSLVNFLIFGVVLFIYNLKIFSVFIISSILYITWIVIFLKKRKEIDYLQFQELSNNQSSLIELINGMQEIKLQTSEIKRRKQWTNIQAKLFKINMKSLVINQYQDTGANSISQFKNIIISFIAATAVIQNEITLGMMLAIQYIVGQLDGPLKQLIIFIRLAQDAKISLERIAEIHEMKDEHSSQTNFNSIPNNSDIIIENLSFKYNQLDEFVLKELNLVIPSGKTTAIVGSSGSGKTTLIKMLLGFYSPNIGKIMIGNISLSQLNKFYWRKKCGAVMQDGYIFSDTIANNITESSDSIDINKLANAIKLANIQDFVEALPLGYNTMIGSKGNGLSQGQKQRLLIARAVYKNPDFLFFDESTNALDTENEKKIIENMQQFNKERTVIVVAHRLSTVKNADQIVVLENGKIVEIGTHAELVNLKGSYFNLIKNQLELAK